MQHLENMQHLREGIGWRSVGQRDPLVEYRSESQKLFDGLQRALREEVLKVLLTVTPSEAAREDITDGEEYDSELTRMAEGATEKGVNEISAGEKNLDSEFRKEEKGKSGTKIRRVSASEAKSAESENAKRNKARKKKKQSRKNKKSGKKRK
jgi:preprotein translocase subunit SecA